MHVASDKIEGTIVLKFDWGLQPTQNAWSERSHVKPVIMRRADQVHTLMQTHFF